MAERLWAVSPISCDTSRAALLLTLTSSRRPLQTVAIARHLARCPECQALRLHLLSLLLPGVDVPEVPCDQAQEDLAAYLDMTLDAGAHEAATAYPQVWWHLWACADCAAIFAQTAALASAERSGALPPLPVAQPATAGRRVIGRLAVAPQMVARLLQTRALLGRAYGDSEELVLDEDESGGYSFQLSVHPEPSGSWAVVVTVIPPVSGQAVIQIGTAVFHAPFDAQGIAQVTGLAEDLFRDGTPAVSVAIEAV